MRHLIRSLAARLALVAALLVLIPGLGRMAFAQAGSRVAGIEFKGNRTLDSDVLRQSLRTKKGALLDQSMLNEDIKTLYDMFATVAVETKQVGDEVTIIFTVTENALAGDVVVKGVDGVSNSDVRAVMDTAKGRPVAEFRVENDARKIERLYRLKGYHFVQVTTEVTDSDAGKVVTFNVLEGPQVTVDTLLFVGNDHVPRSKLLDYIATHERGFLGLKGGEYVEETLIKDRTTLVNIYRREGYLNAQVLIDDVQFNEEKTRAYITIRIIEGPAFTVGKVDIVGADSYPGGADALKSFLRMETGKRFRTDDLIKSMDSIEAAYHDEGFFSVTVEPQDKPSGSTVDMTLKIDEQSKVKVRNLTIVGNEITQDKVIRREISVYPGEVLNQNEVEKSKRRLESLRYFQRVAADVVHLGPGDDPNLRDVKFEVDDTAKTGQVRFAIGASSDIGIMGSFTVTKHNFDWRDWPEHFSDVFAGRAFTGAGQTFTLELSPGTDISSYRLSFLEPWIFDKPISFGWELYMTKYTRFDYDVDRKGANVSLGRRFTMAGKKYDTVIGVTGTTQAESIDLSNLGDNSTSTAYLAEGENTRISERLVFSIDRLDNSAAPTDGWSGALIPEVGIAGDLRLFKTELELRRFFTLAKTDDERLHTLTFSGRVGYAGALGSSSQADPNLFGERYVPIYERFMAGGSQEYQVRGFSYGGAGPHGQGNPFLSRERGESQNQRNIRLAETEQNILDEHGDPLGGNVAIAGTIQYGYPIYEDILGGVIFLDAGMVRDATGNASGLSHSQFNALQNQLLTAGGKQAGLARQLEYDNGPSFFSDLRASVGFGFRIKIPALGSSPIALDFGFPIKSQSGDDRQVLSFSIAQNF
jgi:outer membrane protein insertion porin family